MKHSGRGYRSRLLIFAWMILCSSGVAQAATPGVVFTDVPVFGQDGLLTGYVFGTDASQVQLHVFEFLPDLGWYAKPNCGPIPIQGTGQFSLNATTTLIDRNATRYSAYLLPATLPNIPCVQGAETVPFIIQGNALNMATIPRLPRYKTITFAGLEWYVKSAPIKVPPGPQFFVNDDVYVDGQGRLHLRLARCPDSLDWCAAEVFSKEAVGYGTYTFTIETPLNNLDPNTTVGLFTWDPQAAQQFHREWDIEFSRWGNPNASFNSQYVVQPYSGLTNLYRFLVSPGAPTTHTVTWSPGQVAFTSSTGTGSGPVFSQWVFGPGSPLPVPTPGDAALHLNYYISSGQAPSVPLDRELIVSTLQYVPIGPQIGFTRTSDSVSFLGSSYSVPVNATGAGCVAQVESDSPWLTITGPSSVAGGASIQYSASDNIGLARTGNLILRSTSCDPALGSQLLAVTQAGFTCDPNFVAASTHIGFGESVRSVTVRGISSACNWTATSSSPWLKITSASSGSGDGSVQISAGRNLDGNLRQAWLQLNNGKQHLVYQDAYETWFALSPSSVASCGDPEAQFAVSWMAPSPVEIRLNAPSGTLIGQYGPSGSAWLPRLSDGVMVYLLEVIGTDRSRAIATARTSVVPGKCAGPAFVPLGVVNAASASPTTLAPGALATVFGSQLAPSAMQASGSPYPESLGGVEALLAGIKCPLLYVSPTQINFLVPENLAPGRYPLSVGPATTEVNVFSVSPGIFTLSKDGTGVPVAAALGVLKDGTSRELPVFGCDANGCRAAPINLADLTELYIVLYGTGLRNARNIWAGVGYLTPEVLYAGPQSLYPGLDQVNLRLRDFVGLSGLRNLLLKADGVESNIVEVLFQ